MGVSEGVRDAVRIEEQVGLYVGVYVGVYVGELEALSEASRELLAVGVKLPLQELVEVLDWDGVEDAEWLPLGVGVSVLVTEGLRLLLPDGEYVSVSSDDALGVRDTDLEGPVGLREIDGLPEGVDVLDAVVVAWGVHVVVGLCVVEWEWEPVGGEGLGEA